MLYVDNSMFMLSLLHAVTCEFCVLCNVLLISDVDISLYIYLQVLMLSQLHVEVA
jgi:hypothetical protein